MAAFGRRCIPPPPQRGCRVGDPGAGCVARRSNIPDILATRALPGGRGPQRGSRAGGPGRLAALGASHIYETDHLGLWAVGSGRPKPKAESPGSLQILVFSVALLAGITGSAPVGLRRTASSVGEFTTDDPRSSVTRLRPSAGGSCARRPG